MATPVSIVASGAPPRVNVTSGAPSATPVALGAPPITLVASGAPAIDLRNDDGSAFFAPGTPPAAYAWDFINNQATFAAKYYGALSNTPGWSFTRASTGYAQTSAGVLTAFSSGALRRTDKGVLIEGARTNLLTRSQEFDHSDWTKQRATVSANAAAAPDGTTTADKLIEDNTSANTHRAFEAPTVAAVAHSFGVFAKAGERSWLYLRIDRGSGGTPSAWFNLATGAIGTVNTGLTASVVALANGWYHCRITVDATPASAVNPIVGIATGDGVSSYDGDGTSGIYVWGAQLEAASFPSSYIPTTSASSTRAADVLTVPVSGIDFPLTLFAQFSRAVDTGTDEYLFQVDDGGLTNRGALYASSSDTLSGFVKTSNVQQMDNAVSGALSVGVSYKSAMRVATNVGIVARGGTLSAQDTSVTVPATPTTIRFGSNGVSAYSFDYFERAALWTRALSDAELQSITT